jgi:hypothetical protein
MDEGETNVGDAVLIQDLPVGTRVRLRNGVIAEVTANPHDGSWVFIRYIGSPKGPETIGGEDIAFRSDVLAVVP